MLDDILQHQAKCPYLVIFFSFLFFRYFYCYAWFLNFFIFDKSMILEMFKNLRKLRISCSCVILYSIPHILRFNSFDMVLISEYPLCQGNSISTTKYNFFTFLPKGLFEQVSYSKILVLQSMWVHLISNFQIICALPTMTWDVAFFGNYILH